MYDSDGHGIPIDEYSERNDVHQNNDNDLADTSGGYGERITTMVIKHNLTDVVVDEDGTEWNMKTSYGILVKAMKKLADIITNEGNKGDKGEKIDNEKETQSKLKI